MAQLVDRDSTQPTELLACSPPHMHAYIRHVLYMYRTFSTEEDDRITEAVNLYGSGQWKLGENSMCSEYSEICNPDYCVREDTYTVLTVLISGS